MNRIGIPMRDPFVGRTGILLGVLVDASDRKLSASAEVQPFPPSFRTQDIQTDGATIHVRVGGKGPAVVMLHGFGDTGDMWAPVAAVLVQDHTVIVPDLRGMGLSSHPDSGYDKKTQARDIAQVMDKLNVDKAAFVTHDIGNMVGYAFAAQFPSRVTRWVAIDAPLPGIGPGTKSSAIRCYGTSISAAPTPSVWSRAANVSISTAFGTSSPPNLRPSTKRRDVITPSFMRALAQCIRRSTNSLPSRRMRPTTRCLLPRASWACRS